MKRLPCKTIRASFSAYLDGAVSGHQMQQITRHIEGFESEGSGDEMNRVRVPGCRACAEELAAWRATQEALSKLGPVKAPADLAVRLRQAIAGDRERHGSRLLAGLSYSWQNSLRPLLLQVSAGLAGSVALVGGLVLVLGMVAAPQEVQANDEPLGALTAPHLLYSTAASGSLVATSDLPIIVEASVDSRGRVYDYKIVSGGENAMERAQVANQLLSSVFQPASAFGVPVRSRVVVTFAGISVHP